MNKNGKKYKIKNGAEGGLDPSSCTDNNRATLLSNSPSHTLSNHTNQTMTGNPSIDKLRVVI